MSDELRAAAERHKMRLGDKHCYQMNDMSHLELDDLLTLADAYLAEHPADGETPVDEAWLRSVGFELVDIDNPEQMIVASIETDGYSLNYFNDGTASVGAHGCWLDVWLPCPARGDIRNLARCLGIELREVSNG